ncbi:unnamed protein product [Rangifer tarandus platyrhynchus]|uniref:Uncharacterized protein n=1 Tax=Rangifer tarandus platyrhynchus TaxID=3082113 RepID=A0ABN8XY26_RANTA|nr:unnamed protein product [Rangifer tarandus platyrhynchus]
MPAPERLRRVRARTSGEANVTDIKIRACWGFVAGKRIFWGEKEGVGERGSRLYWEAAEQSSPRDPGLRDTRKTEEPRPPQISPSDPPALLRPPEGDDEETPTSRIAEGAQATAKVEARLRGEKSRTTSEKKLFPHLSGVYRDFLPVNGTREGCEETKTATEYTAAHGLLLLEEIQKLSDAYTLDDTETIRIKTRRRG